MRTLLLILTVVVPMYIGSGCTHNQTKLDAAGNLEQITSTASASRIGPDGTQQASQHGIGPTIAKQDSEGMWFNTPGPVGMLTYHAESGMIYIVSPQDALMTGVKFTPNPGPGQAAFEAATLSFNLSEPLKQHVLAYISAVKSLEGLTKTEAEARVEQMRIAGEITRDIAEILLEFVVPKLLE